MGQFEISCSNLPGTFTTPSFSVSVSGAALTGGADATPFSLSTPAVTLYTYDTLGNLTCAVQKGTDTSAFSSCAAAPATWRPRSFTYNSLSQLTQAVNPESGTITYAYDALHRVTQKSFSDGITPTAKYGYDAIAPAGCTLPALTVNNGVGKRTGMCDAAGAEAWSFDITTGLGWKTTEVRVTNGVNKTTIVQDNFSGPEASLTYPSGRVVSYTATGAGRVLNASDGTTGYASGALYGPQGALSYLTNGAGIASTYVFNNRLQPCWLYATTGTPLPQATTNCINAVAAANILDMKYNFSLGAMDNGNVTAITNNRDNTRSQNFMYDALNRLASAQTQTAGVTIPNANCWGLTFTYDAWAISCSPSSLAPSAAANPIP